MMKAARGIGCLLAGLIAGCDAGDAQTCSGTLVAEGTACVLAGPISETGFHCPPAMPYQYGGEYGGETWVLCSSESDLPQQAVDQAMREGGQPEQPGGGAPGDHPDPGDGQASDPSRPDDGQPRTDDTAACGNAVIDPGEQCDDGNRVDHDGCTSECTLEELACDDAEGDGACDEPCAGGQCGESCGNGVIEPGEQCDDANNVDGDGCTIGCMLEEVACTDADGDGLCDDDETPGPCAASQCGENCGNAVIDDGEQCDDGNIVSGDGCDSRCMLEAPCPDSDGDGSCDPG